MRDQLSYRPAQDKFIKRLSTLAVLPMLAFSVLSLGGAKTGNAAEESELTLIKKNAKPPGTEARGAIDAPKDVSGKTVLSKKSDKDEPMNRRAAEICFLAFGLVAVARV